MRTFGLTMAVLLILTSCQLIPEIEGPYPQTGITEHQNKVEASDGSQKSLLEILESSEDKDTSTSSAEEQIQEPAENFEPEESTDSPEPIPELAEADYPAEEPEEHDPAVTEEPIAQQPPPAQPPVEPPTLPTPPPPPPEPPPSPPPETFVPLVQQEPDPVEEEPPQQERETYTYTIPDMPFQPPTIIPDPAEESLPYSRTVRARVGQYIEIPFRGSGWVYLGEFGSRRGVSYDSRRMDQEGMTFIFRADAEGTYSLRFNRHDFVRDTILNDYVKVIVEQPPPASGSSWSNSQTGPDRVYALPRWPPATDPEGRSAQGQIPDQGNNPQLPQTQQTVSPAAAVSGTAQDSPAPAGVSTPTGASLDAASMEAAPMETATTVTDAAVEDWLKKAREEYDAGRINNALNALNQFMVLYPAGSDEAFWLYGQSLEANNEATRDIRLALDYYRRLTRDFPQSSRYDEARQRIAYLERFYFNIQ